MPAAIAALSQSRHKVLRVVIRVGIGDGHTHALSDEQPRSEPRIAGQHHALRDIHNAGSAARLQDVWIALRTNVREVLEQVTLADKRPESWVTR